MQSQLSSQNVAFLSHTRQIARMRGGDTFTATFFSRMSLKALLGAVAVSVPGLAFALPVEAQNLWDAGSGR